MLKTDKSPICGFEFGCDASGCLDTPAPGEDTEFAVICGAKYPGLWYGVVSGCHQDGVVVGLPKGRRVVGRGFGLGVVVCVGRL